jgi:hypothetical protein
MTDLWHESVIYFGYEICLPDNISSTEFHKHSTLLYSLNDLLPKPLTICSILNRYSNTDDDCLDQLAIIVLGISINLNDYRELDDLQSAKEDCCMLYRTILDKTKFPEINEILDKYDIMTHSKFYNGLEWRGSKYYESDNDDDDDDKSEVDSYDGCSRWEDYENDESDVDTDENSDEDDDSDEYDDEYDEEEDEEEEEEVEEDEKKSA